jgi:hypothetical protein
MTREQLRQAILDGDNQLMSHPLVWAALSQTQKDLIIAGKTAIARDDIITNQWLDRILSLLPPSGE